MKLNLRDFEKSLRRATVVESQQVPSTDAQYEFSISTSWIYRAGKYHTVVFSNL